MAVHYIKGGGSGLWGTLLDAAAMAVPGLGQVMPFIKAGMSVMNGDPAGAVKQIGGMLAGGALNGADAAAEVVATDAVNPAVEAAGMAAHRQNFQLPKMEDFVGVDSLAGNAAANTMNPSGPLMWAHRSLTPGFDDYYDGVGARRQVQNRHPWGWGM